MKTHVLRSLSLVLLVALLVAALAPWAEAQRRRRAPPIIPMEGTEIEWTVFVAAYGTEAARRTTIEPAAGNVELPGAEWSCAYTVPNRARLNETNWSEVRTLECRRADAVVSTTGFCQIAGDSWGARAAVLSLGTAAATTRLQITLDCAIRTAATR